MLVSFILNIVGRVTEMVFKRHFYPYGVSLTHDRSATHCGWEMDTLIINDAASIDYSFEKKKRILTSSH